MLNKCIDFTLYNFLSHIHDGYMSGGSTISKSNTIPRYYVFVLLTVNAKITSFESLNIIGTPQEIEKYSGHWTHGSGIAILTGWNSALLTFSFQLLRPNEFDKIFDFRRHKGEPLDYANLAEVYRDMRNWWMKKQTERFNGWLGSDS